MQFETLRQALPATVGAVGACLLVTAIPVPSLADHNSVHTTACDEPDTVGGGALGNSPGPVGPPNSLGWDVGSGQCNGSFTATTDPSFPGGAIELGMRIEQRRVGQVMRIGGSEYQVELGPDAGPPLASNRAWWNFHHSIAYEGDIDDLDALTFTIRTDVGPNLPVASSFDLLAVRAGIDDRNNQPNPTTTYDDLYQTSQNPEFGWFAPTSDTDANPTGAFNYDAEGAWRMTLTAEKDGQSASVSICVHTPNVQCSPRVDHFKCYDVVSRGTSKLDSRPIVDLEDQFGEELGVRVDDKAEVFCNPVVKNQEGELEDLGSDHLTCYDIKSDKSEFLVDISNQFGEQTLRLRRGELLCVPTQKLGFEEIERGRGDDDD